MNDKLRSILGWLTKTGETLPGSERRQANLLANILLFILVFCIAVFFIVLFFDPHNDPNYIKYIMLIGGLVIFFAIAYGLNRAGHYKIAAGLVVAGAMLTPWVSLLFDPFILQGDFVPLTYLAFSVLLSSILLPVSITITLAVMQIGGITLVLFFSSATSSFNWFSFLAFIVLTSVFSVIANNIIQRNIRQIESQARQLALNEERLRELSIRDYLTDLFNRRYLEETLTREIQRANRAQHPIGVIMLDVDHFKSINDKLGHATGDTVLQEVGKTLSHNIRQSDIACRYGGDEFVLIMPEASKDTTIERAEYLQEELNRALVDVNQQMEENVAVSMGVAVFPDDGPDGEAVLKSADEALYRAKNDGGNRVVAAG